jgi:hypothetical protein
MPEDVRLEYWPVPPEVRVAMGAVVGAEKAAGW